MVTLSDLTPGFCLEVVINSTPKPNRWNPKTDTPSTKTLFELGVIDAETTTFFTDGVKSRVAPLHLEDSDISSSPGTTLQAAADSVQSNAL